MESEYQVQNIRAEILVASNYQRAERQLIPCFYCS